MTAAVSEAYFRIGFDLDDTLVIIYHYGKRNEIMHTNFLELLKAGKVSTLAKILHDDFLKIPITMPTANIKESGMMVRLVEGIIRLWFVRIENDPDNYERWTATPALNEYIDELRAAKEIEDEAAIYKEISKEVIRLPQWSCVVVP